MIATKSGPIDSAMGRLEFATSVPAVRVGQTLRLCAAMFLRVYTPSQLAG